MRYLLNLLIVMFIGLLPAHAQVPTTSSAYWLDESGQAGLAEAQAADFVTYTGTLNKAYTRATLWIKLSIGGSAAQEPLGLQINPPFLREIEIFDTSNDTTIPVLRGRTHKSLNDYNYGILPVTIQPKKQPREIYIRINNPALIFHYELNTLTQITKQQLTLQFLLSTYLGFLGLTCLFGLINWWIQSDLIYGWFMLRQASSIMHLLGYYGIYRYLPHIGEGETYYLIAALTAAPIIYSFDAHLLKHFQANSKLMKAIEYSLLGMLIANMSLLMTGKSDQALYINNIMIGVVSLLLTILAFTAQRNPDMPLSKASTIIIKSGYLLKSLVIVVPILVFNGVLSGTPLTLNILTLHAAASSLVVLIMLAIRSRQREWATQKLEVQQKIHHSNWVMEQARRKEKQGFLTMLTHELRNSLSVMNIYAPKGHRAFHEASQDMSRLLSRVEMSERVDDQYAQPVTFGPLNIRDSLLQLIESADDAHRFELRHTGDEPIYTDEILFDKIFANLFENALKYSPDNSSSLIYSFQVVAKPDADGNTASCGALPSSDLTAEINLAANPAHERPYTPARPISFKRKKTNRKKVTPFFAIMRSSHLILKPAAHSTACNLSPILPLRWQRRIR